MNKIPLGITFGAAAAMTASGAGSIHQQERPNVIVVLTDDAGYGDLACYGNPISDTPNLDLLQASAVSFSRYHTHPMCTPSRSALMTGRDPVRTGADFVCMGRSLPRAGLTMMPEFFKQAGYQTALLGKWHLGSNYPFRPEDRGFDEVLTFLGSHIASLSDYWETDYWNPMLLHNGTWRQYHGFCTDVWFEEAMKWIDANAGQPFFLYLALNAPHGPFWCPADLKQKYMERGLEPHVAQFYGMIENIDWNMGRLQQFLKEHDLYDNTILVFTSDNGTALGDEVYNAGMRGRKRSLYDGGHRVPLFIHWPGHLDPKVIDDPVQTQDLLPTLLDFAGIPLGGTPVDGISLARKIRFNEPFPNRMFVVQYGNDSTQGGHREYDGTVIWDRWRLVRNEELYDIRKDPGQQANVADRFPETLQAMRRYYEAWWQTIPPFEYSRIHIGSEQEPLSVLSAKDWAYGYADNPEILRGAPSVTGVWHLYVEETGTYRIQLLRWPAESNLPIRAGAPRFDGKYGWFQEGVALPVTHAKIDIAGQTKIKTIGSTDRSADFVVELERGAVELATWFLLEDGTPRISAFYAKVQKTP